MTILPWVPFSGDQFRAVIGSAEVFFGLLLLCPEYTRLASFMLLSIMGGAVYVHYLL